MVVIILMDQLGRARKHLRCNLGGESASSTFDSLLICTTQILCKSEVEYQKS